MFPQVFPGPQSYPGEVATHVDDLATNFFMPATYDEYTLIGDITYDLLACGIDPTSGQYFSDFLGYPPLPEDTNNTMGPFSPASSSTDYTTSPEAMNDFSPPPPSPTLSTSSTPEHDQVSPEPSPTPEPSCRQGTPVRSRIRGKWCCSVCDKAFRGKWECKRHIQGAGKRSRCLACGRNLNARDYNLTRHFKFYCKGDVRNLRVEDAFVEV